MPIAADAREMQGDLARLRHDLHREPEIGLDLPRTQEKVLQALDGLPYEITLGKDTTSVTAVLRGGAKGETEGGAKRGAPPRAPAPRRCSSAPTWTGCPSRRRRAWSYTSTIDGAMHACGHDLHTSMLAGAATLLAERRHRLAGDVVLMFQPGEEGFDGAAT